MEFWSAGMGKKHLVLGLNKAKYEVEGEEMVLTGIVDAPANWNYRVTMTREDWVNVLGIATSSEAARFAINSVARGSLLRMALSILKFSALLTIFKAMRMVGIKSKESRETISR